MPSGPASCEELALTNGSFLSISFAPVASAVNISMRHLMQPLQLMMGGHESFHNHVPRGVFGIAVKSALCATASIVAVFLSIIFSSTISTARYMDGPKVPPLVLSELGEDT